MIAGQLDGAAVGVLGVAEVLAKGNGLAGVCRIGGEAKREAIRSGLGGVTKETRRAGAQAHAGVDDHVHGLAWQQLGPTIGQTQSNGTQHA